MKGRMPWPMDRALRVSPWVVATLVLAWGMPVARADGRYPLELRGALQGTTVATTEVPSDGHYQQEDAHLAAGLDGEFLVRVNPWLGFGAGVRYELSIPRDERPTDDHSVSHYLAVPALASVSIPVGESGVRIELLLGLGWMAAGVAGGAVTGGGSLMLATGPVAELNLGLAFALAPSLDLVAQLGARAALLTVENGAGYFAGAPVLHGLIPVRLGICWRL
jgi:hypothetical protein